MKNFKAISTLMIKKNMIGHEFLHKRLKTLPIHLTQLSFGTTFSLIFYGDEIANEHLSMYFRYNDPKMTRPLTLQSDRLTLSSSILLAIGPSYLHNS